MESKFVRLMDEGPRLSCREPLLELGEVPELEPDDSVPEQ